MARRISLFGKQRKETAGLPPIPTDWPGSNPEWLVYWALLKLGMKGRFVYQSPQMGGRLALGGAVIDFYFPDLQLAINVQSTYYHYRESYRRVMGEMQRAQLESMGIRVIYIQEADILRNPVYYVSEALSGIDHTRLF